MAEFSNCGKVIYFMGNYSIWDYIGGLVVTLGTTVIVTTHYAEEARKCDKVFQYTDIKDTL